MSKARVVVLAVILIQLVLLPIIIIASKQQKETRSQASQNVVQADEMTAEGNSTSREISDFDAYAQPAAVTTKNQYVASSVVSNPKLKREVYGFLPYWEVNDNADTYIQYPMLTTLSYFGIGMKSDGTIRTDAGPYKTWRGEKLKVILINAKAQGVKIHPAIVLFDGKGEDRVGDFLSNPESRSNGVKNIVEELKNSPVPVDGVNIDLEIPSSKDRANLTLFIKDLRAEMDKTNPNWTLVIDTFGSTARAFGGFDLPELSKYVDGFFIMSYHLIDPQKSPVAKSKNPVGGLEKIVDQYLKVVPREKIILGFPLYTGEWITKDDSLHSAKVEGAGGGGQALHQEALQKFYSFGGGYDDVDKSAWVAYPTCDDGKKMWKQIYFDNQKAQMDKFSLANTKNIGGIGLWAINQDKGYLDLWNAIYETFADKSLASAPSAKPGFIKPPELKLDPSCSPQGNPTPKDTAATTLNLSVGLIGIGDTGDSISSKRSGNKNPSKKDLNIELTITNQTESKKISRLLTYNSVSGKYEGNAPISFTEGVISFEVVAPGYAKYQSQITLNKAVKSYKVIFDLSPGDVNEDGKKDILDWNLFLACSDFKEKRQTAVCPQDSLQRKLSDLDSNNAVNQDDLNLWIREFNAFPQK